MRTVRRIRAPIMIFDVAKPRPQRLLPMLCNAGDLTKEDIGAIRIQASESFVEIRQTSAAAFNQAVGVEGMLENNIRFEKTGGSNRYGSNAKAAAHVWHGEKITHKETSAWRTFEI